MTVSNVINGNHSKVSQKNIEKIQEIIKKYNYVPNSASRALSSKNSKIIVVFLPSGDFDNPHNVQALNSITNTVKNRGYYLMIFSNLNRMAIGIIEGARLNGIDVPNQLSIIGFNSTPLCEYVTPKLTTIEQDIALKGENAARMLLDLMKLAPVTRC